MSNALPNSMSEHAVTHPGRRKLLWIMAIVAIAGGGFAAYRMFVAGGDKAVQYTTAPATRGSVASQVTATGILSPVVTVQVGSQVSGRIQALLVDFNSKVTKGQVIAKIDPELIESEVARASANLTASSASVARAQAELSDAKQKMDRASALAAKKLVAQADADSAKATYDAAVAGVQAARAALTQSRASLKQAQTNLTYTTIVSPIDGVVISRDVNVGQTVAASLQAPTVFTIAEDLAKMEVHTSVAESDVGVLANDMAVEFTVDAYPTERFRGKVKQVRYSPQTVSNVVTYDAVVEVDNPELKLRPGMTADVTFVVEERENALTVPNTALRFRPSPEVLASLGYTEEDLSGRGAGARGAKAAGSDGAGSDGAAAGGGGSGATAGGQGQGQGQGQGRGQGQGQGRRARRGGSELASTGAPPAGTAAAGTETGQAGAGNRGAGEGRSRERNRRMVWKLGPDGQPTPVRVQIGISDGRQTEIVGGELAEGDQVITSIAGATPAATDPAAGGNQNRGGGGGGRRRPPSFL